MSVGRSMPIVSSRFFSQSSFNVNSVLATDPLKLVRAAAGLTSANCGHSIAGSSLNVPRRVHPQPWLLRSAHTMPLNHDDRANTDGIGYSSHSDISDAYPVGFVTRMPSGYPSCSTKLRSSSRCEPFSTYNLGSDKPDI